MPLSGHKHGAFAAQLEQRLPALLWQRQYTLDILAGKCWVILSPLAVPLRFSSDGKYTATPNVAECTLWHEAEAKQMARRIQSPDGRTYAAKHVLDYLAIATEDIQQLLSTLKA